MALTLLVLSGCGGGGDDSAEQDGGTTTQRQAAPHTTSVDDVTCGELEPVQRRLQVAGELADEYIGTLTARTLLIPAFGAMLIGACEDASADTRPVPDIVEQADVARRKVLAQGGSFTNELLFGETSGETVEEKPATGSLLERADATCEPFRSIVSRDLNEAVSELPNFGPGEAASLGRRIDDLTADLDDLASSGSGANASLLVDFSAGLRELAELATKIADAQAPGAEGDPAPLKRELRERAGELERSMPDAAFNCQNVVDIYL